MDEVTPLVIYGEDEGDFDEDDDDDSDAADDAAEPESADQQ